LRYHYIILVFDLIDLIDLIDFKNTAISINRRVRIFGLSNTQEWSFLTHKR
jgi:hypothetical protein